MSSYVQARDAIVTLLNTALATDKPTFPVFYENTLRIDLDKVADPFLRIEIDFDNGEQLTINNDPWHRIHGVIYLTVFTREGKGMREVYALFDYFSELMKFRMGSTFTSSVPSPGKRDAQAGWISAEMRVPFHFDVTG